jgi:hypothetical protein
MSDSMNHGSAVPDADLDHHPLRDSFAAVGVKPGGEPPTKATSFPTLSPTPC